MIDVYTKPNCPQCVQAKILLNKYGREYREINIDESTLAFLKEFYPSVRSAPVIIIDGHNLCDGIPQLRLLLESDQSNQVLLNG